MVLNRAKDCYKNDKKRLKEEAIDKYRNLSEEKVRRKNMEEIYTIICLKKRNKN